MAPKGGGFLIETLAAADIFTPEDLSAEQRLLGETVRDFVDREVYPRQEALENLDLNLSVELMRKAGELGILAVEVPAAYEGLELDKVTSAVVTEEMGRAGSFTATYAAHVGIGTLPIVYFGTPEQKARYLPDLATGRRIAAYALTEPGSGSDALGARTTARLSPDGGHYILNGSKQWITNAGFADVFVVYAKVDGQHFSAFIVEKGDPGLSTGPEEKKLGIKGSSTRAVILEDARVPVGNLLGEIGKGHLIAFNVLNLGRFKLAAAVTGSCKAALSVATAYAAERQQFGQSLNQFTLIQEKLADMATRLFLCESMGYRTAYLWDEALAAIDKSTADADSQAVKAIHEYAVEASITKVYGSECLDFVIDEALQIHGGYGFMAEYPVSRWYRDARINRIFEGTNEINRLLISGELFKKALKGRLPLLEALQKLPGEIAAWTGPPEGAEPLAKATHLLAAAKKITLMCAGLAAQKYGPTLDKEQEILARISDMVITVFAVESGLLRAEKSRAAGVRTAAVQADMAEVSAYEGLAQVENLGRSVLAATTEGEGLAANIAALRKLARHLPANTVASKRRIAERVIRAPGYPT